MVEAKEHLEVQLPSPVSFEPRLHFVNWPASPCWEHANASPLWGALLTQENHDEGAGDECSERPQPPGLVRRQTLLLRPPVRGLTCCSGLMLLPGTGPGPRSGSCLQWRTE